jgi:two-component system sensor histidine kinase UhpB
MSAATSGTITQSSIRRVLIAGFSLVILFLVAAGSVGLRNLAAIRANAAELLHEQAVTMDLLNEVRRQQRAINAVYQKFDRRPDSIDREEVLEQLEASDHVIERIAVGSAGQPDQQLWTTLVHSSTRFSEEAKRLLEMKSGPYEPSEKLFEYHQSVLNQVGKLVELGAEKSEQVRARLDSTSSRLTRETGLLLGGGLLLAMLGAFYTMRVTTSFARRMEWQASELGRVSWQMLANQESVARRFSHELHDELGQSLTAVKANLAALDMDRNGRDAKVDDCRKLLDEALSNVREMSQLLRPTILDDFGLSPSLRWLCDGFTQRTRIAVDFHSKVHDRLTDEIETHLFRLAQEALTNVARHSGATKVTLRLDRDGDHVRLRVADNGNGLPEPEPQGRRGMGLVGMRARARSAGGELHISSQPGHGVTIEAIFPFRERKEA